MRVFHGLADALLRVVARFESQPRLACTGARVGRGKGQILANCRRVALVRSGAGASGRLLMRCVLCGTVFGFRLLMASEKVRQRWTKDFCSAYNPNRGGSRTGF
jgi:hypothetical protein